jgi:hypothetical protein
MIIFSQYGSQSDKWKKKNKGSITDEIEREKEHPNLDM